jgi:hypothetical protein
MVWIKRWMLFAVGLPLAAWAIDKVANRIEDTRGQSDVTKGLHGIAGKAREWRSRKRR